jgi:hypothetical protein
MNAGLKSVLRLAGIGLVIFGLVGNLPQGWAVAAVAVGLLGVFFGGGGG